MNSSPILRVAFLLCASFAGISCVPFQRQAAQTRSLWHQPRCVKEDDAQRAIAIAWVRRCESAECMDPVRAIGKNVAPWAVAKRGSVLVSIPHAPPNTVPKEISTCALQDLSILVAGAAAKRLRGGDEVLLNDPDVRIHVVVAARVDQPHLYADTGVFHVPKNPCPSCRGTIRLSVDGPAVFDVMIDGDIPPESLELIGVRPAQGVLRATSAQPLRLTARAEVMTWEPGRN